MATSFKYVVTAGDYIACYARTRREGWASARRLRKSTGIRFTVRRFRGKVGGPAW